MDDLRVISDVFQDGVPGYYTNEFMVLKDGPIKTLQDLKDTVVATNLAGSAVDIAMRSMLVKNGINPIIEVPFPNIKPELKEKKVTLIAAVRPFSADPALRSMARTLFTQKGRDRALANDHHDRPRRDVAEESRGHRRFSRGPHTRSALVHGSGAPRGSGEALGRLHQTAAGAV
jgi:hypothetical protein